MRTDCKPTPLVGFLYRLGLSSDQVTDTLIRGIILCSLILGFCAGYLFAQFGNMP